jgi:hypothetical protein
MANNFVQLDYLNINTDCILKKNKLCSNNTSEYKYKITKIPLKSSSDTTNKGGMNKQITKKKSLGGSGIIENSRLHNFLKKYCKGGFNKIKGGDSFYLENDEIINKETNSKRYLENIATFCQSISLTNYLNDISIDKSDENENYNESEEQIMKQINNVYPDKNTYNADENKPQQCRTQDLEYNKCYKIFAKLTTTMNYIDVMPILNYIAANSKDATESYEFNIQRYSLNLMRILDPNSYYTKKITFKCFQYNEAIVKAYEFDVLKNKAAREKFIQEQQEYIRSLKPTERLAIRDYTNLPCFSLYLEYLIYLQKQDKGESYNFIKEYENNHNGKYKPWKFGDGFKEQIRIVYANIIATNDPTYQNHELVAPFNYGGRDNLDISVIGEERDLDPINDMSPDYVREIPLNIWEQILNTWFSMVQLIIINAPPVKEPIFGYRSSSTRYIVPTSGINEIDLAYSIEKNILEYKVIKDMHAGGAKFISSRFSSISFDYDASTHYYPNEGKTPVVYRTKIETGCRVLFIPSLSVVPHELEILTPIGQVYYIPEYIDPPPLIANSKNNKADIKIIDATKKFTLDIVCVPTETITEEEILDAEPSSPLILSRPYQILIR